MPRARKSLGQHFLHDPGILRRIAAQLEARPGDTIVEVGPGPGGLTAELARLPVRLVAVERDRELVAQLRLRFPSLELAEGDALELDWHRIAGPGPVRIVGNIPYNITSPLIEWALSPPRPVVVVYLVQKEVGGRLAARPGTREYGALTVGVNAVAQVERLFAVPAGAFSPRPRVDSVLVRLRPLAEPLVNDAEVPSFRRFVVGLFSFRRKQLARGLRELTGLSGDAVTRLLALCGLDPTLRPESLTPTQFVLLFRSLSPA